MRALVSIHDVMPQTLERVQALTALLDHLAPEKIALLVVPGLDWRPDQLEQLGALEQKGFILAGHGWFHKTREIRGLYHHLHATFISRQAAEHLCLDEHEISELIQHCYQWFEDNGLRTPDLYVPPAWAMGNISRLALNETPFRYFETTSGYYDCQTGRSITLPLTGFEADNTWRVCCLTGWNALNRIIASDNRPLRVSIHPNDAELLLQNSLRKTLQKVTAAVDYRSLF